MAAVIEFFVPGIPQPGGSKKAFVNRKTGRAVVVEDAKKNRPWRERVMDVATRNYQGEPLLGPLYLECIFTMPRLKGHYGSGKNADTLRANAPQWPAVRPDTTKLLRAVEDSLSGVIWRDDSQIVSQYARKVYGEQPGVKVQVLALNGE